MPLLSFYVTMESFGALVLSESLSQSIKLPMTHFPSSVGQIEALMGGSITGSRGRLYSPLSNFAINSSLLASNSFLLASASTMIIEYMIGSLTPRDRGISMSLREYDYGLITFMSAVLSESQKSTCIEVSISGALFVERGQSKLSLLTRGWLLHSFQIFRRY